MVTEAVVEMEFSAVQNTVAKPQNYHAEVQAQQQVDTLLKKVVDNKVGKHNLVVPDEETLESQLKIWNYLLDYYFRTETTGWNNIPSQASMLVGVHSGSWLTMDAWVLCGEWARHFKSSRYLHGTAHDMLMVMPGLGEYFRKVGVISARREAVSEAFALGRDVAIWPGGEVDAMRSWSKRYEVVLGGRKGFVRQAIRSGVPIVPVATVGGHDTVFVLSECRSLAKMLGLKKLIRSDVLPLVLGFPFGVTFEVLPMHLPLPSKICTEFLEPIEVDSDPDRENDNAYVDHIYQKVESAIQAGVNRLASKRRFPVIG